jgi:hypothetical protein
MAPAPIAARDESARVIDAPARIPPLGTATATRAADAGLRVIAGVASIALAAQSRGGSALGLALLGAASLLGVAPRTTALAIALGGGVIASAHWGDPAALLLAGLCALRLRLHTGSTGAWLDAVRRLERSRAFALVATGLARSRRSETGDAALGEAGDHYEREGAARRRLAELGATPSPWLAPALGSAERLGAALRSFPRLRERLEQAAHRGSR